ARSASLQPHQDRRAFEDQPARVALPYAAFGHSRGRRCGRRTQCNFRKGTLPMLNVMYFLAAAAADPLDGPVLEGEASKLFGHNVRDVMLLGGMILGLATAL